MDIFRRAKATDRLASLGITAVILAAGLTMTWKGTGRSLLRLNGNIQSRQQDIEHLRHEIIISRKLFLQGDDAEQIRSRFEQRATPSQYFGEVLDEIRDREAANDLLLRSVSLEPPERAGNVARIRFSLEVDAPFGAMTAFLTYLEEAFPAYQVNHIEMARSDGERTVSGVLTGSLFIPQ